MYSDSAAITDKFMTFYQLIMNYLSGVKLRTLFGIIVILHSIAYGISYYLHKQSRKQMRSRILKRSGMSLSANGDERINLQIEMHKVEAL